jgi:hypothetical protein
MLAVFLTMLVVATPASARHLATHSFSTSFHPQFNDLESIAVDEASGYVYIASRVTGHGTPVSKFDSDGTPVAFTAPEAAGATTVFMLGVNDPRIAVDNSGGENQGRIYLVGGDQQVAALKPSGIEVGGNFPIFKLGACIDDVAVQSDTGNLWAFEGCRGEVLLATEYTTDGGLTGTTIEMPQLIGAHVTKLFDIDTHGNTYVGNLLSFAGDVHKFDANQVEQLQIEGTDFAIDPKTDDVYVSHAFSASSAVTQYGVGGSLLTEFGPPAGANSIAVNGTTGRVYTALPGVGGGVNIYDPGPSIVVPDATTTPASNFTPTSVTLHGTVNPDGVPTTDCYFEWGANSEYGGKKPCAQGTVLTGSTDQPVSAGLTGLVKGAVYHYRVVAANTQGTITGLDRPFTPSAAATLSDEHVSDVHSDSVVLSGAVNPEGATSTYHFEYGTADCAVSACMSTPTEGAPLGLIPQDKSFKVTGLEEGTTYHYRIVVDNQSGPTAGADHTFTTFPITLLLKDPCANAHIRQQTSAALLLNCRAYELVSAENAGGYDVESNLVPGQNPFGGYPNAVAPSKALYAVHDGAIPGVGNPANRGLDTYVATRGEHSWTTKYVGIPSDNPFAGGPFASSLLEADQKLDAFAFGGPEICDPCFADGSTNIPLRLPNEELVQGMTGSRNPEPAEPSGYVGRHLSGDGSHFVFGTKTQLELAGNNNGDVTIYERDLLTDTTQVVSTLPTGATMSGPSTGELDVSKDGSRVVIGQKISSDAAGNDYWHLYMHIDDSPDSVDLTPSTTSGVLFDGMTRDGARVFYSTVDGLTPPGTDTDESVDIYETEVDGGGTAHPRLISIKGGTASNDDSCEPSGAPESWNSVSGEGKCGAVAFAGGAGVSSETGRFYFVSPEQLDGSQGDAGQVNLYVVEPGGDPKFVAVMDSSLAPSKPPAPTPNHPVVNPTLLSGLSTPESLAVDQLTGDIYVAERGVGRVSRYTEAGAPDNFTDVKPYITGNKITGLSLGGTGEGQIAVDSHTGSLFEGALYVTSNSSTLSVFASTGKNLGTLTGFSEACGVAVDQSTGIVYVADWEKKGLWKLVPTSNSEVTFNENYTKTRIETQGMRPCQAAADTAGHAFGSGYASGPAKQYDAGEFTGAGPSLFGAEIQAASNTLTTDPATDDVYIDEGDRIARYDSSLKLIQKFGAGSLSSSRGIAINQATKHVYVQNGSAVVEFGIEPATYHPIDNPAVIHAVQQSSVLSYGDFQVSQDGRYAAFSSMLSLTGFDNGHYYEVFRYDAQKDTLTCASCNPTNARAVGDSTLPEGGLGLDSAGRVFFDSADAIAPRDLDAKIDAYEFGAGTIQLISTGVSPFDSRLLGVSADGTDAFFFTRDTLVPQDENGDLVKIYDARADGGFEFFPPPVPCKASDECHGAGSEAPGPPEIRTIRGSSGNEAPVAKKPGCKRHRIKRNGLCVKPKRHTRKRHKRQAAARQG